MDKRLFILNGILVLVLATLAYQVWQASGTYQETHDIGSIQPEPEIDVLIAELEAAIAPAPRSWVEVSDLNPFSSDRNDIAILSPVTEAGGTVTSAPRPVLWGTMLLGGDRVALLGPPDIGTFETLRVGELLQGWQLVEINRKSVVVAANGGRQTVVMNDPTISIPRSSLRTGGGALQPAVVVNPTPTPEPTLPTAITPSPGQRSPQPQPAATGPRVIQTPFGNSIIRD
jgi:hypothetical protein